MKLLTTTLIASFALVGAALADGHGKIALKELPDAGERDYWLPEEVNAPGLAEKMRDIVGSKAVPFKGNLDKPIQIALIYPSSDTSDFWARNYLAMTKRLEELGIEFETTEFASRQVEHSLQSTYANQVAQDADLYDYVVFGPSELATQADNISKLSGTEGFATFVWAFHTVLKDMDHQPKHWFDFNSSVGALNMCAYLQDRLGKNVIMSMNRGIPGITDNQRSGDFKKCIEEEAGWTTEYEHYGQYTDEGGFQGTSLILQSYPDSTVIHNANTAMALGSVEAQLAAGKEKEIFSTGWGGTGKELEAIRRGELDATPMRMGDDVGAATAEAIKYHLEGRSAELPRVFEGRITVAHDQMSEKELSALEKEAFRFSGIGPLDR